MKKQNKTPKPKNPRPQTKETKKEGEPGSDFSIWFQGTIKSTSGNLGTLPFPPLSTTSLCLSLLNSYQLLLDSHSLLPQPG